MGYYIAAEATKLMIEENVIDFKKHLMMFPFDEHSSNFDKKRHREFMISKANVSIFMYGSGTEDSGMIEEYEISKLDKNRIIIPVGSTGGSAKLISKDIKKNIILYPYLEKYIETLDNETDADILSKTIMTIINENLRDSLD